MSETIPYIQRCRKYLLHCPAYSLRNDIYLWLLSGAHLWVPPLSQLTNPNSKSSFSHFSASPRRIIHLPRTLNSSILRCTRRHSPFINPMQSSSTKQWYLRQLYRSHRMNQANSWNAWDVLRLKEGHCFQRRPFKKSPFQVAEKNSKQIQGTWCFGLNGHRREPIRWWFCARTV